MDAEKIILECVAMLRSQAKGKKLELEYKKKESAPESVWGDERRLKQVLLNLLGNAVKFTEKGRVDVVLGRSKQNFGGVRVAKICVKDTGLGIKEEDLCKLFREFEMLETHRRINPNGTSVCQSS